MKPKLRAWIIGGLLFATLAAAFLIDDEAPPVDAAIQRAGARKPAARAATITQQTTETLAAALAFPEPAADPVADPAANTSPAEAPVDPFHSKSWVIAPPPPPPPKPVAPALPFQYLGKLTDGDHVRVFLSAQGKQLIAQVGDVINGVYTVESIAGGEMTLLYQPLKERQKLAIGDEK